MMDRNRMMYDDLDENLDDWDQVGIIMLDWWYGIDSVYEESAGLMDGVAIIDSEYDDWDQMIEMSA